VSSLYKKNKFPSKKPITWEILIDMCNNNNNNNNQSEFMIF
jgi:hypothetical protein